MLGPFPTDLFWDFYCLGPCLHFWTSLIGFVCLFGLSFLVFEPCLSTSSEILNIYILSIKLLTFTSSVSSLLTWVQFFMTLLMLMSRLCVTVSLCRTVTYRSPDMDPTKSHFLDWALVLPSFSVLFFCFVFVCLDFRVFLPRLPESAHSLLEAVFAHTFPVEDVC